MARDLIEFGWMDCCVTKCDVERQMYYSCFDLGVAVASKIDITPSTMYFSTILCRYIYSNNQKGSYAFFRRDTESVKCDV